ncbi:MAG: 16S rRNA (cytosine(1402)-N(4))-methyltransferase RsmH [Bacteroidia bacterium]|nr:16S rRNA (cytosine(1402)-N(4))-methyltransferase RsmH [Bacteroidia bacterium]
MNTPYHRPAFPVLGIDGLNIKPGGTYVDVTMGGGTHTRGILQRLGDGRLVAFDQDADAVINIPDHPQFTFIHGNFRYMINYLDYLKLIPVDGIIADLGVSSHHFDTAGRGFSFRTDQPLDMRMNPGSPLTAGEIINTWPAEELVRIFRNYGELPGASRLASAIIHRRASGKADTSFQLVEMIREFIPRGQENKFLAKVFQALRIEVNDEIGALKDFLSQTIDAIAAGGRLVVISYHSLEDKLVKNFLKYGNFEGLAGKDFFGNLLSPFKPVNRGVIVPGEEEILENNRIRSAKLRIGERV